MLKTLISQGDFAVWPQISLALFLLTFVAILVWVFRRNGVVHYDRMASLVLESQTPTDGEKTCTKR